MIGRVVATFAILLGGCKNARSDPPLPATTETAHASTKPTPIAAPVPTKTIAPPRPPDSVAPPSTLRDACALVRPAVALSFTGPVAIEAASGRPVFNQKGAPVVGAPLASGESATKATSPACAIAAGVAYCADPSGTIHRVRVGGEELGALKGARPGGSIAAAALGDHTVVGYLADHVTTEGRVLVALASLDGAPPVQLSEEGSGATFIALAPRGDSVVAMYVDARVAMTPLHARTLAGGSKLEVGKDAVLFVGEGTTRAVPAALAIGPKSMFAVVAGARDMTTFGMAAVTITDPPADDAPAAWSLYPAAVIPALVAASGDRVARVRPVSADEKGTRAIEVGTIDERGEFKPRCLAAEAASFSDVTIATGPSGAVSIAYTSDVGTFLAELK